MAFIIFRLALYVALFINNYGTALESDFTDFTSDSSAPYTTAASTVPYRSCEDYCANGDTSTGVKQIFINGNLVNVFCYG
uniref:Uncharacterized protein n=1 Tax=Plectus sambesii TaxID=2011161 RepID=A0A914V0P3_9BILA